MGIKLIENNFIHMKNRVNWEAVIMAKKVLESLLPEGCSVNVNIHGVPPRLHPDICTSRAYQASHNGIAPGCTVSKIGDSVDGIVIFS